MSFLWDAATHLSLVPAIRVVIWSQIYFYTAELHSFLMAFKMFGIYSTNARCCLLQCKQRGNITCISVVSLRTAISRFLSSETLKSPVWCNLDDVEIWNELNTYKPITNLWTVDDWLSDHVVSLPALPLTLTSVWFCLRFSAVISVLLVQAATFS